MDIQIIAAVVTIIAANFGLMKFLLKDTHKEVEILKIDLKEFKQEYRQEIRFVHNRLDGLYRVLLEKTYGENIPEELK